MKVGFRWGQGLGSGPVPLERPWVSWRARTRFSPSWRGLWSASGLRAWRTSPGVSADPLGSSGWGRECQAPSPVLQVPRVPLWQACLFWLVNLSSSLPQLPIMCTGLVWPISSPFLASSHILPSHLGVPPVCLVVRGPSPAP